MDLREDLPVCKFCGNHPNGGWGSDCYGFGSYYISCDYIECEEQPCISDSNKREAEVLWKEGDQYE